MNITFTKEELAKYAEDLANWYNGRSIYVLENFAANFDPMQQGVRGGKESFHRLCKQYQETNPKPDWRYLL